MTRQGTRMPECMCTAAAGRNGSEIHLILAYIFRTVHKYRKNRKKFVRLPLSKVRFCGILLVCIWILAGCSLSSQERVKLRDLDFTVLGEEKIPEQLKTIIEEKKNTAFEITYTDNENLYICIGYGEQETGGYSIAVDELYLTDTDIVVSASLLGPEAAQKDNKTPTYPYIVIRTEYLEQTVTFE